MTSATTWSGLCTGCHRDGLTVGSRLSHGLRVLCGPCAAKPYRMPSATGLDPITRGDVNGNAAPRDELRANGNARVVVTASSRESVTTTRYAGRRVDIAALPAKPPQPIPWRVHDLVADGSMTILSGESGAGKSWLAQSLCVGVTRGHTVAGLLCAKGNALYIDAEMGPSMFVDQRLRVAGIGAEFELRDAMGLDISTPPDLAWLRREIEATGAKIVVIDSLRRLVPSKPENDSDAMAPTISALAKLARDTRAAILLLHHKGDSDKYYRGSTAIRDQCDALFALLRTSDDDDDPVRRLACGGGKGKMRYAAEPRDVFLAIAPERGGVVACDRPGDGSRTPTGDTVKDEILGSLPCATKTAVARAIGRKLQDRTFRDAWADLERTGKIERTGDRWGVVVIGLSRENVTTTPPALRLAEGVDGAVSPPVEIPDALLAPRCACERPLRAPDEDGDLRCTRCGRTCADGWGGAA